MSGRQPHLGVHQGPLGTPAPLGGNQGPSEQSRGPEGPQRVLRMVLERCSFPWFFQTWRAELRAGPPRPTAGEGPRAKEGVSTYYTITKSFYV